MKYSRLLFFFLFSIAFTRFSNAQTNVGGEITSNTTWDLAGSPFVVQSDVVVDTGVVLTIEPGVIIKFDQGTSLGVHGTIRAVGDASNQIWFGPDTIGNPIDYYWAGVYISSAAQPFDFTDESGCFFQYCKFTYSGTPNLYVDPTGNTTLTVFSQVSLGFDHCLVENSACGLVAASGSLVSKNIFKECASDFYSGYLVKVSQNSQVYKNLIYKTGVSTPLGLISLNKNIEVYDNLFIENSFVFSNVFNFEDSCLFFSNTLVDNSIDDISVPIRIDGSSIYNNTFTRNNVGFETLLLGNCDPDFHNNNVLNNPSAVQGLELEMMAAAGSGSPAKGEDNYWGLTDSISIANILQDYGDNSLLCRIDFIPFETTPDTLAPVIPVMNVMKKDLLNGNLKISWNKNKETDLKGYKVYYGGYSGYSFSNFLDAGMDTTLDLAGVGVQDPVGVTAYDLQADGNDDQFEGHESWFTLAVTDTTVGISSVLSHPDVMSVFPNPGSGEFSIHLSASYPLCTLSVFDEEGRKVTMADISNQSDVILHLENAGIYLLQVTSAERLLGYQKIVVIK